jgi:CrcB protein
LTGMNVVYVFIAGGIGCVCRWGLSVGLRQLSASLPVATFVANIAACLVLALAVLLYKTHSASGSVKLLLLTGFCGGLSTFSTFSYETMELVKAGSYVYAGINVLANLLLGFLCFYFIGFTKS